MKSRLSRFGAFVWGLRRSPLAWVLFAAFVLHLVGIGWGLPGSDAWEDDGIAPRDFLVGAYETYTPGHYFTYPPVHLLGLSLLTSPIWGLALAKAPSLAPADVIPAMIQVPTMTALTIVARLVSECMAIGILYALSKLAEEVWGKRAGLFVAVVLAANAPLTYYAHTSNLDVPYLCWACFALLEGTRAIVRHEPRRLRKVVLFAALAVGTKDQAYAIFLLGFPVALVAWFALDREARAQGKSIAKELAIGTGIWGALFLLVSGAITNPSGFRARLHFLLGPASQNHAYYPATWAGKASILGALARIFERFYPWPFAAAIVVGLLFHVVNGRKERARFVAGFLPLLGAISFVVCFNFTARRTEHRFAMPEMVLIGVYAGVAFDAVLSRCRSAIAARGAYAVVCAILGWGLFVSAAVDANLVLDPRYDAERWLEEHVKPGDVIEVYGVNAYLPRFPAGAKVTRVDMTPLSTRPPLPNVVEVEAPFADIAARRPRFVLVPDAWAWRWYADGPPPPGQVFAPEQALRQRDDASRAYFHGLHTGAVGYRKVHVSSFTSRVWPRYDIHSSTAKELQIFQREP